MDLTYREATADDAAGIAILLGELGYPAEAEEIPGRLAALAGQRATIVMVAVHAEAVVGVITAMVFPALHSPEPVAWITSMVVSSEHRSHGIGSALVERIEKWALGHGAARVSLTSALRRENAHAFYVTKQGYEKTGLRFSKVLEPDRP